MPSPLNTHYNQPLAHPLGANFQELIAKVYYQPAPKWVIDGTLIYYYKGLDTPGKNFGGDIFKNYVTRSGEDGFFVGNGNKAKCVNAFIGVSYELRQNLFLEASYQGRKYTVANSQGNSNTSLFTAGVRLNIFKRHYDY